VADLPDRAVQPEAVARPETETGRALVEWLPTLGNKDWLDTIRYSIVAIEEEARAASQERPQPDECVFAECAEHGGGYCERHDHHSMADPFGQPFGHPGVAQERPQPPFRTDSDLLDAYQDCIEREEAREAKPDLWDDIYGEDGTAAQERPSIDVDARRLFDLLWDERGALDAGIEGFSPNRYRSAARRILWRLSSPVPVEPGE
jgi:hypothetical protein